ncbi:restriction endonuclease [uncultured Helicobacter sp.]|uniref:restriction endonuclease n=1 Tax=uncultured Helicobacter sp. TaxID=175537 RepID=UPI002635C193|nr:restriction endonuclease [uncultured Helicobacter sp.]
MRIESVNVKDKKIRVEIPLTTQSGKIRVKIRNSFYEYGIPTATKEIPFSQKHYIEWQIGYDVDKSDKEKLALSTLQETHFVGANEKNKALYELSEYLYYFVQWGIINKAEIENLCTFLQNLKNEDFIDSRFVVLHLYFFQYCEETKERILLYRLQTKCLPIVAFYKYLLLKI